VFQWLLKKKVMRILMNMMKMNLKSKQLTLSKMIFWKRRKKKMRRMIRS